MKKPAKSKLPTNKVEDAKSEEAKTDQPGNQEPRQVGQQQMKSEHGEAEHVEAEQMKAEQIKADALKGLCDVFVDSAFYKKAMTHPGYLREEAIKDFLISLDQPFEQAVIELIRQNYYRSF